MNIKRTSFDSAVPRMCRCVPRVLVPFTNRPARTCEKDFGAFSNFYEKALDLTGDST